MSILQTNDEPITLAAGTSHPTNGKKQLQPN